MGTLFQQKTNSNFTYRICSDMGEQPQMQLSHITKISWCSLQGLKHLLEGDYYI